MPLGPTVHSSSKRVSLPGIGRATSVFSLHPRYYSCTKYASANKKIPTLNHNVACPCNNFMHNVLFIAMCSCRCFNKYCSAYVAEEYIEVFGTMTSDSWNAEG